MFNREHQNGSDGTPTARWLTVWEEEGTYGERVLTPGSTRLHGYGKGGTEGNRAPPGGWLHQHGPAPTMHVYVFHIT